MITNVELVKDLTGKGEFKQLYRINFNKLRLYIQNKPFNYYSGLTGALSSATFRGSQAEKRIQKWREGFIDNSSKADLDNFMDLTATFGTHLHEALVTIKEKGAIDWAEERDKAEAVFIHQHGVLGIAPDPVTINRMVYEYQKQVSSMMKFIYERVQEIYAIETPAIWSKTKIATPIDFVCLCKNTPKAPFKKTTINIKTSKYITDHHLKQGACELVMWNETYSKNYLCEHTGILRTVDYREKTGPSFDYKHLDLGKAIEVSSQIQKQMLLCLEDRDATYYPEPNYKRFEGVTKVGEDPIIKHMSLEETWIEYWEKTNKKNEQTSGSKEKDSK